MGNKSATPEEVQLASWVASAHRDMAEARMSGEWDSDYPQMRTNAASGLSVREQIDWDATVPLYESSTPIAHTPITHATFVALPITSRRSRQRLAAQDAPADARPARWLPWAVASD